MNTTCPNPIYPDALPCSGTGIGCVNEECVCPEGWTGHGDFVSGSRSCAMYMPAVRALWAMCAGGNALALLYTIYFIRVCLKQGKLFGRGERALLAAFSLGSTSLILCLGLVRTIAVDSMAIGSDPAATVLFALGSACTWTNVLLQLRTFLRFNLKQTRMKSTEARADFEIFFKRFDRSLPLVHGLCMIACLAPLFILIDPSSTSLMFGMGVVHFVTLGIGMMLLAFVILPRLLIPVIRDLEEALEALPHVAAQNSTGTNKKFRTILNRIKFLKRESRNQSLVNMVLAVLFGAVPYLQNISSYEIPIAWTSSPFIIFLGLYLNMPSSASETSAVDTGDTGPGGENGAGGDKPQYSAPKSSQSNPAVTPLSPQTTNISIYVGGTIGESAPGVHGGDRSEFFDEGGAGNNNHHTTAITEVSQRGSVRGVM